MDIKKSPTVEGRWGNLMFSQLGFIFKIFAFGCCCVYEDTNFLANHNAAKQSSSSILGDIPIFEREKQKENAPPPAETKTTEAVETPPEEKPPVAAQEKTSVKPKSVRRIPAITARCSWPKEPYNIGNRPI